MHRVLTTTIQCFVGILVAFVLVCIASLSNAEAVSPPIPGAPTAGSVEAAAGADAVASEPPPSAPLEIPSTGITVTVDIPLVAGWNLVAIPVKRTPSHTAQSVLNEIGGQGGSCSEVDRWLNGGWDAHINGLPFNDFAVQPGKGYFVKCTATVTWHVTGELIMAPVPLSLTPGWNLVALPYGPHADQAQAWLNDIIAQGGTASEVDRWLNGGWDAHINGLPFNNFDISKTQGYFVKMSNAVSYVPKPPTQTICGTISTHTTWTSDKIWLLTCSVTINAGTRLTVEAGTVVKFQSTAIGITVNGTLLASGAVLDPIAFTSYKDDSYGGDTNGNGNLSIPFPGDWMGLDLRSTSMATLDHMIVEYGGGNSGAGLDITSNNVTVSNSIIRHSSNYGMYLTTGPTLTNNTISNNLGYPIRIPDVYVSGSLATPQVLSNNGYQAIQVWYSGPMHGSHVWPAWLVAAGHEIHCYSSLSVASDGSLTLPAGAVLRFSVTDYFNVAGGLIAQGTSTQPILLTVNKATPAPGDWEGLNLTSTSTATLDHVIIEYGGGNSGAGLDIASSNVTVSNSIIRHSSNYGMYLTTGPTLTNNTISNNLGYPIRIRDVDVSGSLATSQVLSNNGYQAIQVWYSGPMHGGHVWPAWLVAAGHEIHYNNTLSVASDGSLTLPAGAVLRFSVGYNFYVAGALTAQGTSAQPILLTVNDATPAPGDWMGLDLASTSTATLDHVIIEYGGRNSGAGLEIDSSNVTVSNSTIRHSSNYGMYLTTRPALTNNTISNNVGYPIRIRDEDVSGSLATSQVLSNNGYQAIQVYYSGTLHGNHVWPAWLVAAGHEFHTSYLFVASDGSLTLPAGAVLRFSVGYRFDVSGALTAQGTSAQPILLTVNDATPAPGDWDGLSLTSTSSTATLDHVIIEYGGRNSGAGLDIASSNVTISNSTIRHSSNYGMYLTAGPTLTNNIISNNLGYPIRMRDVDVSSSLATPQVLSNNGYQAIQVWYSGPMHGSHVWPAWLVAAGHEIHCNNTLSVANDGSLTLPAGAVLRFSVGGSFNVSGALLAQGTSAQPILLTVNDAAPAPGDWNGLDLASTSTATLDHVIIEYGGRNTGAGLEIDSSNVTVSNSTIRHNTTGVIVASSASHGVRILHNRIYGNTGYGIHNNNQNQTVDARYNYWGADNGPAPYGSGNGINTFQQWNAFCSCYITRYAVTFVPWKNDAGQVVGPPPPVTSGTFSNFTTGWAADPVNVVFGHYSYQYADLAFPTRGEDVAFQRTYSSASSATGPLGPGWTHSYSIVATQASTNTVTIQHGDGRVDLYTDAGGGVFLPPPGVYDLLTRVASHFVLTRKDRVVYTFNGDGTLASIADRNGNTTTFAYSGGKLTALTEPAGRQMTFGYSGDLLAQITDPAGRTVQFSYTSGRLTGVADVRGYTTTYAYDADGRLQSITDANGHRFVDNLYDSQGRVVEQRDALNALTTFAYDPDQQRTTVVDPRGFATVHTYDSAYRIVAETDPTGHTTAYAYDADNNRTQVTDKNGNVTQYTYDSWGNLLTVSDALGQVTTMTYDDRYNLLTRRDALNRTTSFTYDSRGNLTRQTDALNKSTNHVYDAFGQVRSSTDPRNNATLYGYDPLGHQNAITDALGAATVAVYDAIGRKLILTDALGRTTTTTYDLANHVLTISEPLGKITSYSYDAVGNRVTTTDPRGGVTHFVYDAKNRLATVTDPLNHTTSYGYDAVDNQTSIADPLGHVTTRTYDALNRLTSTQDPLGNATSTQYDPNGNHIAVTDPNGNVTRQHYDPVNRLIQVTDALSGTVNITYDAVGNRKVLTDARNHSTTYDYDAVNRLTTITDPLSHLVSYAYDAGGNRIRMTKADGTVVNYSFDTVNRLTSTGSGITYTYDATGNRTGMVDAQGTTTYTYDALNRLVQTAGPTGTVSYTYDLGDNRTGVTYPGNRTVSYAYDLANRLITLMDWSGRTTTYSYDAANRPTSTQYPNAVTAAFTYDNADRLLSVIHNGSSRIVASAAYTLDAAGNRLSMQDPDGVTSYSYDNLHRLIQVVYPNGEQVGYTYDAVGNRTAMTSTVAGATSYVYDAGDRLLSYSTSGGTVNLTWDANGNLTGKGSETYSYDVLDRLSQVGNATATVQFAYSGDGVRVRKTVNGVVTTYLQDLGVSLPVVLTETTGGQSQSYVYGSDLLMQSDPTDVPVFYHGDGLGSTRALSSLAGQQTDVYSYADFGAIRSHTGPSSQAFQFTGEQVDTELGLVFLRKRYYDPVLGRFLQTDPVSGAPELPQSMNRYAYAQNNPVNKTDPTGASALEMGRFDGSPSSRGNYSRRPGYRDGYYAHSDRQHMEYADPTPRWFTVSKGLFGGFNKIVSTAASLTGSEKLGSLANWTKVASFGMKVADYGFYSRKVDAEVASGKYGPGEVGYKLGQIQKSLGFIERGLSLLPFQYGVAGGSTISDNHMITRLADQSHIRQAATINKLSYMSDNDIVNADIPSLYP